MSRLLHLIVVSWCVFGLAKVQCLAQEAVRPRGKTILPLMASDYPLQPITSIDWSTNGKVLYVSSKDGCVYRYSVEPRGSSFDVRLVEKLQWPMSRSQGVIQDIAIHPASGDVACVGYSAFDQQRQVAIFSSREPHYQTGYIWPSRSPVKLRGAAVPVVCEYAGDYLIVMDDSGYLWSRSPSDANGIPLRQFGRINERSLGPRRLSKARVTTSRISADSILFVFTDVESKSEALVVTSQPDGPQIKRRFEIEGEVLALSRSGPTEILAVSQMSIGDQSPRRLLRVSFGQNSTSKILDFNTPLIGLASSGESHFFETGLNRNSQRSYQRKHRLPSGQLSSRFFDLKKVNAGRSSDGDALLPLSAISKDGIAAVTDEHCFGFYLADVSSTSQQRIEYYETDRTKPDSLSLWPNSASPTHLKFSSSAPAEKRHQLLRLSDGDLQLQPTESIRLAEDKNVRLLLYEKTGLGQKAGAFQMTENGLALSFAAGDSEPVQRAFSFRAAGQQVFLLADRNGGLALFRGSAEVKSFCTSLVGHRSSVLDAEFIPDRNLLVTLDRGGIIHLWEISSLLQQPMMGTYWGADFVLTPQGLRIASIQNNSGLKLYGWDKGFLLASLYKGDDMALSGALALKELQESPPNLRYSFWSTEENADRAQNVRLRASLIPSASLAYSDSDWVAWTPFGNFDASPGAGNRLLVWQFFADEVDFGQRLSDFRSGAELYDQYRRTGLLGDLLQNRLVGDLSNKPDDLVASNRQLPRVTLSQPAAGSRVNSDQVTIEAVVDLREKALGDFQIVGQVNGRPLGQASITELAADNKWSLRWAFSGPESCNRVSLRLIDVKTGNYVEDFSIFLAEDKGSQPKVQLLTIAVDDYNLDKWKAANVEIRKLLYAKNDADLIQSIFTLTAESDQLAGALPMFAKATRYWSLSDGTRQGEELFSGRSLDRTLSEISSSLKSMGDRDFFVLYIAAHGHSLDKKKSGRANHFFVQPPNPEPSELPEDASQAEIWPATMIEWSRFDRFLSQLPCRSIVLLDTCNGGAAAWDSVARTSDKHGVFLLTASGPKKTSFPLLAEKHSIFAYVLREAIRQKVDLDEDGFLSLADLALYARSEVDAVSAREVGRKQSPEFKDLTAGASELKLFKTQAP